MRSTKEHEGDGFKYYEKDGVRMRFRCSPGALLEVQTDVGGGNFILVSVPMPDGPGVFAADIEVLGRAAGKVEFEEYPRILWLSEERKRKLLEGLARVTTTFSGVFESAEEAVVGLATEFGQVLKSIRVERSVN